MGMKTPTRFLHPGDKKEPYSAGGRLGHPAEQRIQIGAKGLAYGLAEVEDLSIRLLGPTGRDATGPSAGQQGLGTRFIEGEFGTRSVSQFILHGL